EATPPGAARAGGRGLPRRRPGAATGGRARSPYRPSISESLFNRSGGEYASSVQIKARLEEATIQQLLNKLLPATILLAEQEERGRWIRSEPARKVDFIADRGLRLESSGQIQWLAAGLPITLTLNTVQLLLQPEVLATPAGGRLVFHPSLEDLDLKNVPGF